MLESGQALALATDQRAERFAIVALGHDVEAARLAGGDLDGRVEAEVAHQRLEDALPRGQRLGRGLGSFEVRALRGQRPARRSHFGRFGRRDIGATPARCAGTPIVAAAVIAARATITELSRAVIASRTAVAESVGSRSKLTSLFAAATVAAVMLFLTPYLRELPQAALGGILIAAAWNLCEFSEFGRLWRFRGLGLVGAILVFAGVIGIVGALVTMQATTANLEDVFIDLTGHDLREED